MELPQKYPGYKNPKALAHLLPKTENEIDRIDNSLNLRPKLRNSADIAQTGFVTYACYIDYILLYILIRIKRVVNGLFSTSLKL